MCTCTLKSCSAVSATYCLACIGLGFVLLQDFPVSSKMVMQQWQQRKLSTQQALDDLVTSRCTRAVACITVVEALRDRENAKEEKRLVEAVLRELEGSLGRFRDHPVVQKWLTEHVNNKTRAHFRSSCLLLRGASRAGKTQKAFSLFGYSRTLVVNCQGLGTALPSLREFMRTEHDCIVFDEIDEQQVLQNKLTFQCGPWPVELSQSVCNQHSYRRWFYNCAMILCSNTFRMTEEDGLKDEAAIDWLRANIYDARLDKGEKWYEGPAPKRRATVA